MDAYGIFVCFLFNSNMGMICSLGYCVDMFCLRNLRPTTDGFAGYS